MSLKEYKPGAAFPGAIGLTVDRSSPAWPSPIRSRQGTPNVLIIVLDDTGFGQLGCYGSPIRTPHLDKLAAGGLRFTNMHTTALCSPTRSCILTGRNHHSNGMACVTEVSTGFPGYNGSIPFENGFLSEQLLTAGYNTYAIGKWHLTPVDQTSAAGPYDRWPLGRGFERYYGFLGGDTSQYYPDLVHDNHQVEPPGTPEEGYHLTPDLVAHACQMIADGKQVAPDKPFFMYFCPGAMHAPHHAPREWIDRYKGAFDAGWEVYRQQTFQRQLELGVIPPGTVLAPADPDVPEWSSAPAERRRVYARMMEVFAGFLEHTDHHLGQLFSFLDQLGQLDDTLIMLISDNGASAEGGPEGSVNENKFFNNVPESIEANLAALDELGGPKHFNHYPWGWTSAGNTPFRRWKRETYRGGVSDAFIVHWPGGIKTRGENRTQYAHAVDLVPTVLECLQLEPPLQLRGVAQSPLEGVSLAGCFNDAKASSRHRTQYFEMFGHRALYHDGWRAVCPVPGPSFKEAGVGFGMMDLTEEKLRELDATAWELYEVSRDASETKNVAKENPALLRELIALWYAEAGKYKVFPIDSRGTARFAEPRPQLTVDRRRYVYYPNTSAVGENAAVRLLNRPHSITASVELENGAEGVLIAQGGNTGGFSLFVKDHRLHYVHNYVGSEEFHVESAGEIGEGKHELRYEFQPTGRPDVAAGRGTPGRAQLYVDGELVGQAELPTTMPLTLGVGEGLKVGRDAGSSVSGLYAPPFAFTGTLHQVEIDVSGELIEDKESAMRAFMARQ